MSGRILVDVEVSKDEILNVAVTECSDSAWVKNNPISEIPADILKYQSVGVDVVTGASMTSYGIIRAVEDALEQAGGDMDSLRTDVEYPVADDIKMTADVIIVGGGGAGMTAALAAVENGASVVVVEKAGFIGGNSVVSGGALNCANYRKQDDAFTERSPGSEQQVLDALAATPVNETHAMLQKRVKTDYEAYLATDNVFFDSPNWHELQTYFGGDFLGSIDHIEILTHKVLDDISWLEGYGMKYSHVVNIPGSLYTRAVAPEKPKGSGYFEIYLKTLEKNENFTLLLNTEATELVMDGESVVGVLAEGKDGHSVELTANNGVILATGGFAGNVALRQEYCESEKWPDLGKQLNTTNMSGITGDGIYLARDAGAALVNMDQFQVLHITNPISGAIDHVRGTGLAVFVNQEGKRFVREDGRRDEISLGILAQTGGYTYMIATPRQFGEVSEARNAYHTLPEIIESKTLGYYLADTLEELAEMIDIDYETLQKTIDDYNSLVEKQEEGPFGRVLYTGTLTEGPWLATKRAPAAHHTMGGVAIDTDSRVLNADGEIIDGLYAAGEVTGVIHGKNRLGGNAIADFIVFGKIAGESAALSK